MLTEVADLDKARVLPWVVSDGALARLAEVHQTWHLMRHDVWVSGDTISPCPRSLWLLQAKPLELSRQASRLRMELLVGILPD